MIILFHHIQKTAGNTLKTAFANRYGVENLYVIHPGHNGENMTADDAYHLHEQTEQPIMIASHEPGRLDDIGISLGTSGPKVNYITLFRNPIERSVSHFAHLCRNPNNSLWDKVQESMVNGVPQIDKFLAENSNTEVSNLITKQLCRWTQYNSETAIAVASRYMFVGHSEDMPASIQALNNRIKIDLDPETGKTAYNIGKNRPLVEMLSEEARTLLVTTNTMDLEVWEQWK